MCVSICVWKWVLPGDFPQSLLCLETDASRGINPQSALSKLTLRSPTFSQQLHLFSPGLSRLLLSLFLHRLRIKCPPSQRSLVAKQAPWLMSEFRKQAAYHSFGREWKSRTLMAISHQGWTALNKQVRSLARVFVSPPPRTASPTMWGSHQWKTLRTHVSDLIGRTSAAVL